MGDKVPRWRVLAGHLHVRLESAVLTPPGFTVPPARESNDATAGDRGRNDGGRVQRAGGALVTAFSTAAGNGNVGVVRQQATAIRSWATAEAAWLDVHPALYCFAAAYIIWDSLRGKADSVASEALAGNYDQSASDLNDMSDYSTRAVDAISQAAAHC